MHLDDLEVVYQILQILLTDVFTPTMQATRKESSEHLVGRYVFHAVLCFVVLFNHVVFGLPLFLLDSQLHDVFLDRCVSEHDDNIAQWTYCWYFQLPIKLIVLSFFKIHSLVFRVPWTT